MVSIFVEEEQKSDLEDERIVNKLFPTLSKKLSQELGKGVSETSLRDMRQFYFVFPNLQILHHQLTWTHYRLLMGIDDKSTRDFYVKETIKGNWRVKQLNRQVNSVYFERLLVSKDRSMLYDVST